MPEEDKTEYVKIDEEGAIVSGFGLSNVEGHFQVSKDNEDGTMKIFHPKIRKSPLKIDSKIKFDIDGDWSSGYETDFRDLHGDREPCSVCEKKVRNPVNGPNGRVYCTVECLNGSMNHD